MRRTRWPLLLLATIMLATMFAPSVLWRHPTVDATYRGFDRNLLYLNTKEPWSRQASASITTTTAVLNAPPYSQPSLTLWTTPLRALTTHLQIKVLDRHKPALAAIGIWSARNGQGFFLNFGDGTSDTISAVYEVAGGSAAMLLDGTVSNRQTLGSYLPGRAYDVDFLLDKQAGSISVRVADGTIVHTATLTQQQAPSLLRSVKLSFTAAVLAGSGQAQVRLTNYRLTLLHQPYLADKTDDPALAGLVLVLAGLGVISLLYGLATVMRSGIKRRRRQEKRFTILVAKYPVAIGVAACATAIYLVGNALLFHVGSHPFDMLSAKDWTYIAITYSPGELYFLPNVTTLAQVWASPYHEAVFPYGPVMAYLFFGVGAVARAAAGPSLSTHATSLEYLIKSINVLFGLADAALIYLILSKLRTGRRWSALGTALFLFNPAVWFSMSVWGQNHVISIFFVLLAVYAAQTDHPTAAWLSLGAAALTRPQMLVIGFLLALALVAMFPIKRTIQALAWVVVVVFVVIAPLALQGIAPSLPVDMLATTAAVQEFGANEKELTTVSLDAYTIWPVVARAVSNQHGVSQIRLPASTPLIGAITYQRVAQLLTASVLLLAAALVYYWARRRIWPEVLLAVAFGTTAFLVLLTGIAATHFLLALPFLVLTRRALRLPLYLLAIVAWSSLAMIPMFGSLGSSFVNPTYQSLPIHPLNSGLTKAFMALWSSEVTVSFGGLTSAVIVLCLGFISLAKTRKFVNPELHG